MDFVATAPQPERTLRSPIRNPAVLVYSEPASDRWRRVQAGCDVIWVSARRERRPWARVESHCDASSGQPVRADGWRATVRRRRSRRPGTDRRPRQAGARAPSPRGATRSEPTAAAPPVQGSSARKGGAQTISTDRSGTDLGADARRAPPRGSLADHACLKKRSALPESSFFLVSPFRLCQARMLSTELGNWHSECG